MTATTSTTVENNTRSLFNEYQTDNPEKFITVLNNRYDPIYSQTYTPLIDVIAKRVKATYSSIRYRPNTRGQIKIEYRNTIVKYSFTKTEVAVYGALTRYMGKNRSNAIYPSQQKIALLARCSKKSVRRAIEKFENELMIFRIKRGNRGYYYAFVPLKDDGFPDENSGEYQVAKALLEQKVYQQKVRSVPNFCPPCTEQMSTLYRTNVHPDMSQNSPKNEPCKSPPTPDNIGIDTDLKSVSKNASDSTILDKVLNKTTTTKQAGAKTEEKSGSCPSAKSPVVVGSFETLKKQIVRDDLRKQFNQKTYERFAKAGLTDGQIRSIIFEANQDLKIKSWGLYFYKIENAVEEIKDQDILDAENQIKLKDRRDREETAKKDDEIETQLSREAEERYQNFITSLSDDDFKSICIRCGHGSLAEYENGRDIAINSPSIAYRFKMKLGLNKKTYNPKYPSFGDKDA